MSDPGDPHPLYLGDGVKLPALSPDSSYHLLPGDLRLDLGLSTSQWIDTALAGAAGDVGAAQRNLQNLRESGGALGRDPELANAEDYLEAHLDVTDWYMAHFGLPAPLAYAGVLETIFGYEGIKAIDPSLVQSQTGPATPASWVQMGWMILGATDAYLGALSKDLDPALSWVLSLAIQLTQPPSFAPGL